MKKIASGPPMRFAVLVSARHVQEWQARCVRALVESAAAEPTMVAVVHELSERGPGAAIRRLRHSVSGALFSLYRAVASRRGPARRVDLAALSGDLPVMDFPVEAVDDRGYELGPDAVDALRERDLDFVLCLGREPSGPVGGLARHGVWTYRFGTDGACDPAAPCVWEVYAGLPVTEGHLCKLDDGLGVISLRTGRYRTARRSWKANRDVVLSDTPTWAPEICAAITETGHAVEGPALSNTSAGPGVPTNLQTMRLLIGLALRSAIDAVNEILWRENWNVGVVAAPVHRLLEDATPPLVKWLPARSDVTAADPFAVEIDDRVHLFYERFDYRARKGVISHLEITNGSVGAPETVLELPIHVSYPFPVRRDGTIYLVPETVRAREVALYEADAFPRGWRKVATLLDDVAAIDPTVFRYRDRWWLFATIAEEDEDLKLFAWHAHDLFGPWHPHARNPIKTDVSSTRPAGTPFVHGGSLYRPAQDCSETYGGRVVLNRVTSLSATSFSEETVAVASPDPRGPFPEGLHTVCQVGDVTVIDGKRRVLRPPQVLVRAAVRRLISTVKL